MLTLQITESYKRGRRTTSDPTSHEMGSSDDESEGVVEVVGEISVGQLALYIWTSTIMIMPLLGGLCLFHKKSGIMSLRTCSLSTRKL